MTKIIRFPQGKIKFMYMTSESNLKGLKKFWETKKLY